MSDLDKLWAPWRIDYILNPKQEGCIFCDKSDSTDDRKNLVLFRGKQNFVLMNLYPYNNAHLMIAPYEHKSNTHKLQRDTLAEILKLADDSMMILEKQLLAQGFNFGANIGSAAGAGIEDHIHFHVVPRWIGDTNYMPIVGHTKVLFECLLETYDKLKPYFDNLNQ